jgi:hypothetical protein
VDYRLGAKFVPQVRQVGGQHRYLCLAAHLAGPTPGKVIVHDGYHGVFGNNLTGTLRTMADDIELGAGLEDVLDKPVVCPILST